MKAHASEHHIVPVGTYFAVYVALLLLLGATFGVYYINLGFWSIALGITIAVVKSALILMYFMHVRFSSRLVWVFAAAGFAWLAILVALTLSDYVSRAWLSPGFPELPFRP
jgi:cytochrome c oxidase subunit 4